MEFILASGSPRRKELLTRIGITDFAVIPADIEERVEPGLTPQQVVLALSAQKAQAVAADHPHSLVLAADTVVCLDGLILGKPHSQEEAREMLRLLAGHTHLVCTGFTLRQGDQTVSHCEETQVTFRPMTEEDVAAYVATGEPMDKAGAYGIQERGALLVTGIRGDYFNVMGLPLCSLGKALKQFGVDLMAPAKE